MPARRSKKVVEQKVNWGQLISDVAKQQGVSEESVKMIIENAIKEAYNKARSVKYDNCIVVFGDDNTLKVFSKKTVVDGVYDPVIEISVEDAKALDPNASVGDEIDVEIDPKSFSIGAVTLGKQTAHRQLGKNSQETLKAEYEKKKGELVAGTYLRESKGNIIVDLPFSGKVEGFLPVKNQIPREIYEVGDRIRAVVTDVKVSPSGVQLILSRAAPEFVKQILFEQVPEIADGTISIYNIVREAGYRTKVAVYSKRSDIDAVGACVGLKGIRIQNVIHELDGEKIDILKYDEDPREFIKNALSPAEVSKVIILDSEKREALAVVSMDKLSMAIGQKGQNARLANKLCDWLIDVKTEEQAAELDLSEIESRRVAEDLFADNSESEPEEITVVGQLDGIDPRVAQLLKEANLDEIQEFVDAYNDGRALHVKGLNADDIEKVYAIVNEQVEFEEVEEEEPVETQEETEEEYFCPECGEKITLDMTKCPKCGAEFSFEEE
ncbi:MAG: transcription termination factor NusA [Spirochaetales bacterium]|nr:transcription termination factor NusA [Spirochaetales bacterium]